MSKSFMKHFINEEYYKKMSFELKKFVKYYNNNKAIKMTTINHIRRAIQQEDQKIMEVKYLMMKDNEKEIDDIIFSFIFAILNFKSQFFMIREIIKLYEVRDPSKIGPCGFLQIIHPTFVAILNRIREQYPDDFRNKPVIINTGNQYSMEECACIITRSIIGKVT